MPLIQSAPGRGRYLVSSANGEKLSAFLSELSAHPELHLLDTLGPSQAPHTAVFDMPHEQAAGKGQPVAGAEVYLFGSMLPAQGVTDTQGRVRLTLYGETATSLRKLYVKPRADF